MAVLMPWVAQNSGILNARRAAGGTAVNWGRDFGMLGSSGEGRRDLGFCVDRNYVRGAQFPNKFWPTLIQGGVGFSMRRLRCGAARRCGEFPTTLPPRFLPRHVP